MSSWSFAANPILVIAGLAIWSGASYLGYLNWNRHGRRRLVGWLEFLRAIIVGFIVITLFRPEVVKTIERTEAPTVAILTDASGSMITKDAPTEEGYITRQAWLETREDEAFWLPIEATAEVDRQRFAALPKESERNEETATRAEGTDLHQALSETLDRGSNLKAVLLLTDGSWNQGKAPIGAATRYRDLKIPIFAVGVGSDTALPDLSIEGVTSPAYGLLGEQIAITVVGKNNFNRPIETQLLLKEGDEILASKDFRLPNRATAQETLLWKPEAVGERTLQLEIPVVEGETVTSNNSRTLSIAIREETLKVLVIDSLPRWEYRYLRNALARDPGVDLSCLLFHPTIGRGQGQHYIREFPKTRETLGQYDVIFLGDVGIGPNELTTEDAESLAGLIEQQSSGLVFIAGRRGRHLSFAGSPLEDLLPVTLDESKALGTPLQNEAQAVLTSQGEGHLLTRFHSNPKLNGELWSQLPGFFWSSGVVKARPGAEVLAVHSLLRNSWGRMPILVTRPFGNGKTLYMGTDSAWRWRRGVEDKYHYRLWSQVVRWMAHQRHLSKDDGIRVTFSPESPQVGETVFLQATVMDSDGYPIEQGEVTGTLKLPSGDAEQLDLEAAEAGWGVFASQFVATEGGTHQLDLECPDHDRYLTTDLNIVQPLLERIGEPVNRRSLTELAKMTGGRYGALEDFDEIIASITALSEPEPYEKRFRLWSHPSWMGTLIFLLAIYWTGRKFAGMI